MHEVVYLSLSLTHVLRRNHIAVVLARYDEEPKKESNKANSQFANNSGVLSLHVSHLLSGRFANERDWLFCAPAMSSIATQHLTRVTIPCGGLEESSSVFSVSDFGGYQGTEI
jgi:hypothetical protein